MITGAQIRAARALLGWSQMKLAKEAGIGEMTVKRFEKNSGNATGTVKTLQSIERSLVEAGIVFIPNNDDGGSGVRLARTSE